MYRDATVGVVVPAYNESGFVGDVLQALPDFVDRVYAVDDASTDDTWTEILATAPAAVRTETGRVDGGSTALRHRPASEQQDAPTSAFLTDPAADLSVVRAFEERVDRLVVQDDVVAIGHTENFGAGGAIKTGYLAALVDGVDVTVTIDADGQMDPTIMDRLVDPVVDGSAEYAKGTRLLDSSHREKMPLVRVVGNTALTYLTKVASGYWGMTDSQNGYTAISRSALQRMGVEDLFEYYAYCNAVLVRLNVIDAPIADVEVETMYGEETSDIELAEFVTTVTPMLWRRFYWRLRQKHGASGRGPVTALYALGGLCLFVASLVAASLSVVAVLGTTRRAGSRASKRSSLAVFGGSAGVGVLALLAALLAERRTASGLVTVVPADDTERAGREQ